jgi:hypothetical protein
LFKEKVNLNWAWCNIKKEWKGEEMEGEGLGRGIGQRDRGGRGERLGIHMTIEGLGEARTIVNIGRNIFHRNVNKTDYSELTAHSVLYPTPAFF